MNPNDPIVQPTPTNEPQPQQPAPSVVPSMEFVPPPPESPSPSEQPIQMPPYAPTEPSQTDSVTPDPLAQTTSPENNKKTDTLGVISLVCVFLGLLPVGFVIGLVGASHAKKEHRSVILSRIGWILNLVIMLVAIPVTVLLVLNNFNTAELKARDLERSEDLGSIRSGLEEYFNTNFGYPNSLDDIYVSSDQVLIAPNGSTIKVNDVVADEAEALASEDPSGSVEYTYTPYGKPTCLETCDGYVLKALIESPTDEAPNPLVKLGLSNL